ncbi:DUF2087 domain-containing protein [Enterococcus phoeniculicola]|uniref:HTH luxR-type domain-containing protein n=1 Tax=Enterococcus phoeniculicola ATCC BAA-412 TaxID=1158610 RepID=R3W324_9ENTE|nr:DUF2087 domain-containing protein [Enterococcus phoeniculicola]EOL42067.1 hypothetical protein UC3_02415 [Enterococcus phoeniculicola ATCC BAA-412]EOT79654.1 hypothetical protein I589_01166 [Enterococcus phoeniculicola ATCC BAA-412]
MDKSKVYEIADYKEGFTFSDQHYQCLFCGESFEEGVIYKDGELQQTAARAIKRHVATQHDGVLTALLSLPRSFSGLSETQQEVFTLFAQGISDTVIAQRMGISTSTVRNHRFKLKEKERQARVFVAMMSLLSIATPPLPHEGATMIDDRYQITEAERKRVIQTYVDENGFVQQFPSKEKRKIIILGETVKKFDRQKNYSEQAVNEILKQMFTDYVTVRRYLIEYGFMQRTKDGQTYWVHS